MLKSKKLFAVLIVSLILFTVPMLTGCTPEFKIILELEPKDAGKVTGGGTYKKGEAVTVSVKPVEGYKFKKWLENGEKVSEEKNYQFVIKKDKQLTAVIEPELEKRQEEDSLAKGEELIQRDDLRGYLLPVVEDGALGFINQEGEAAVKIDKSIDKELFIHPLGHLPMSPVEVSSTNPLFLELSTAGDEVARVIFNTKGETIAQYSKQKAPGFVDALPYTLLNESGIIDYKDGKYGFIDHAGDRILGCKYDDISIIPNHSFIKVTKEGKAGIFESYGKEKIIDIAYDDIEYRDWLESGVLKVKKAGESYLFGEDGKKIAALDFDKIRNPSDELAAARQNDKWGFINTDGETVVEPVFDEVQDFAEGFSAVKQDDKWGFIDQTGEFLLKPNFDNVSYFTAGMARFQDSSHIGFVNASGKIVAEGPYRTLIPGGSYYIFRKNDETGILAEDGEVIFEPVFEDYRLPYALGSCDPQAAHIAEGFSTFKKDGYWAVFTDGQFITDFMFKEIKGYDQPMKYGDLVQMIVKEKESQQAGLYCVETGDYIIPPGKYDDLDYLKAGRALVKQDGRYGFVDKTGQIVIDLQYDYATSFVNGAAAVFKEGKLSFIDKRGNVMVEPVEVEVDVDVDAEDIFLHYFKEPGVYKSFDYSYFDEDGWIRKP